MESSKRGMADLKQLRPLAVAERGRAGAGGRDEQKRAHGQGAAPNGEALTRTTKWYLPQNSLSTSGAGARDDAWLQVGRYAKDDKGMPQQLKAAFQFRLNHL